jgi:hypothetical protein
MQFDLSTKPRGLIYVNKATWQLTESKGQGAISGHDVVALDVDEHQVDLLAQLNGVVAVLQDLGADVTRDDNFHRVSTILAKNCEFFFSNFWQNNAKKYSLAEIRDFIFRLDIILKSSY